MLPVELAINVISRLSYIFPLHLTSKAMYNYCQEDMAWEQIAKSKLIDLDPTLSMKDQVKNYYSLFFGPTQRYNIKVSQLLDLQQKGKDNQISIGTREYVLKFENITMNTNIQLCDLDKNYSLSFAVLLYQDRIEELCELNKCGSLSFIPPDAYCFITRLIIQLNDNAVIVSQNIRTFADSFHETQGFKRCYITIQPKHEKDESCLIDVPKPKPASDSGCNIF